MTQRPVLVAAGGTGGHLFPAQSLSEVLTRRGIPVELATDERAVKFGAEFPARIVHHVAAATPTGGSPFARAHAIFTLIRGTQAARRIVQRVKPRAIIGFGGYPTVPPLLAGTQLKVPTILHEANAVMGRANMFLARRVRMIAKGFDNLAMPNSEIAAKTRLTGNPDRPAVLEAARDPYPPFTNDTLRVLVTGGSQGARIMSEIVPAAIERLSSTDRARLHIVQQARSEDEGRVRQIYAGLGLLTEISPFFPDLPRRIADAHLVIARAGASTVSELAVIGRPAILVPFPHALDQDQAGNAEVLRHTGSAIVVKQTDFTPDWLADAIRSALSDRKGLQRRAAAARGVGISDAAERLADLVQDLMLPEDLGRRTA